MNFKTVRLGNICQTNTNSYSLNEKWAYVNYLDTGNITQNKIDNIQHIDLSSEKLPSRARRKVFNNDIIFSTVRPNQLHYGFIKEVPDNFLVSTGFTTITTNEKICYSKYLYYFLTQSNVITHLHAIAEQSMSAYPSIKSSDIEDLKISLPDLETQHRIASVLSALDDKIELNNKINKNLEEQAQAIFKSWFAEFKQNGILSDIADITMGQSPKGTSYNMNGAGTVFFQGRTDFGYRFPTIRMYTTAPKKMAETGDILMSVRAPVGDLNIANQNCCIGRGLASVRSKDNHSSFLFYTLSDMKKQLDIFNGQGTVFGSINQKSLNELSIVIPPYELIEKFEKIVSPLDKVIRNNYNENQSLSALRDALLPELMDGRIDVSEINK